MEDIGAPFCDVSSILIILQLCGFQSEISFILWNGLNIFWNLFSAGKWFCMVLDHLNGVLFVC